MKLEVDKYYVTRGGYVVHIIKHPNIYFYASIESSPGVTKDGLSVRKNNTIRPLGLNKFGWTYDQYGVILGLNSEWQEKLTIVEELPCPFPEKLPEEYKWAGGFPQFRKPKNGEFYFSNSLQSVLIMQNPYSSPVDSVYSGKRFILESVSMSTITSIEDPEEWVEITDLNHVDRPNIDQWSFNGIIWKNTIAATTTMSLGELHKLHGNSNAKYRCKRKDLPMASKIIESNEIIPVPPKLSGDYEFTSTPPKYDYPKSGDYYTSTGSLIDRANFDYIKNKYFIVKKKDPAPSVPRQKYPKYFQSSDKNTAFVKVLSDSEYRMVDFDGQESLSLHGPISPRFDYRCEFTEQEALALLNPKVMSFSYWVTEPIGNMVKAAKKSVRYIVITSILSASTYTVVQPAKAVSFVKSCLPKVSIKFNS